MNAQPLNRWALSRALTEIANASPTELAQRALPEPSRHVARRIGVTGAPGSGKSTLAGRLALERLYGGRLGILAIDPSSPHSGGAILGDRVRMDDLLGSEQLYIRSLGSRKTNDGLADNLPEMLELMDQFGFDEVIVETVGVGQAEYAVRNQVNTLVLVLLPDSGDMVQAMKAGIMELADIYVVNKADLPGAHRAAADLRRIAAVTKRTLNEWVPPILLTSSNKTESVQALSRAIDQHQEWLNSTHRVQSQRLQRARYRLKRMAELRLAEAVAHSEDAFFDTPLAEQLARIFDVVRMSTTSVVETRPITGEPDRQQD